jgi:hypothetical protein
MDLPVFNPAAEGVPSPTRPFKFVPVTAKRPVVMTGRRQEILEVVRK